MVLLLLNLVVNLHSVAVTARTILHNCVFKVGTTDCFFSELLDKHGVVLLYV